MSEASFFTPPPKGNDVHYDIVRLGQPPAFDSGECEIAFDRKDEPLRGPGRVTADTTSVGGQILYQEPPMQGDFRTYGSVPGYLIGEDQYATVTAADGESAPWRGEGGYLVNRHFDFGSLGPTLGTFSLSSLTLTYAKGAAAYTRELFCGPPLSYSAVQYTHTDQGGVSLDRIECNAFGRRTTLRDLGLIENQQRHLLAVVYDGPKHEGAAERALWLGTSVVAGDRLQPAISERYDESGNLISRTFQLGVRGSGVADPPFHLYYARIQPAWLSEIFNGILARLEEDFPIDVIIALLHDANDGAMERRMQTYLLAIHAASEAWTRQHGRSTIIDGDRWKGARSDVAEPSGKLADALSEELGKSVRDKIGGSNNTGMNERLRAFCDTMGIALQGGDKKAVDLRNTLFHNGYLMRRYETLTPQQQQERVDYVDRLRDFTYRCVFASIGFTRRFHGALHGLKDIPVQNVEEEPEGQVGRAK